jgi:Cdc6-like AAA superfamily ATPase
VSADGPPPPLRLLLLGTAGTGKTTTVRTVLQEIRR